MYRKKKKKFSEIKINLFLAVLAPNTGLIKKYRKFTRTLVELPKLEIPRRKTEKSSNWRNGTSMTQGYHP